MVVKGIILELLWAKERGEKRESLRKNKIIDKKKKRIGDRPRTLATKLTRSEGGGGEEVGVEGGWARTSSEEVVEVVVK